MKRFLTITIITLSVAAATIFNYTNFFTASARTNDLSKNSASNDEPDSPAATFVVNSAADTSDGSCTTNAGGCTLREAIIAANNSQGVDTIQFALGATPVINVGSNGLGALPQITQAVTINGNTGGAAFVELNGTSAGGHGFYITGGGTTISRFIINRFSGSGVRLETGGNNKIENSIIGTNAANAAGIGNGTGIFISNSANNIIGGGVTPADINVISGNNVDGVRIDGANSAFNLVQGNRIGVTANGQADLGNTLNGIVVSNASGNVIGNNLDYPGAGNLISGNNQNGIAITGSSSNNAVGGNTIGLASNSNVAIPNGNDGVYILNGATNNLIGGAESISNTISGNAVDGVRIDGATTSGNKVYANIIGVYDSTTGAANGFNGVVISNAPNNFIGATFAADTVRGNTIAGNGKNGIGITGATATGNTIQCNSIGTTSGGGNGQHGLLITGSAANNLIGGEGVNEGNSFSNNAGDGIYADSGTGNRIIRNDFSNNGGLGIDLGADGVTANDTGDADTGANNLQNFPVLTAAQFNNGNTTTVSGTLNSKPNMAFTIHFFVSDVCDASGYGEGRAITGSSVTVNTDANGNAALGGSFSGGGVGKFITATATDSAGSTSEISACIATVQFNPTIVQFSSSNFSVNENVSNAVITVTRSGGTSSTDTVFYAMFDGTAQSGQDYTATNGSVVFQPGQTSRTFNVPIINDTMDEPGETVSLRLGVPPNGATLGTPNEAILTITDDDAPPALTISDAVAAEGDTGTTEMTFIVSLSASSALPLSVNYATADDTANAGADYTAKSGTLNFAPFETMQTFTVNVIGDTRVEPSETLSVNLSNPTNATIADGQGIGTIINDDAGGVIRFSAAAGVNEGEGIVALTIIRTGGAASDVSVNYSTQDISAVAGQDYTATNGTATFAANESSKTINIPIINDALSESNETFRVNLSAPSSGATLGSPNSAIVTIADNDGCGYSLAPAAQNVPANSSTASFSVNTAAGCAWTATSGAAWIIVTAGASGSGSGAVNLSVEANTGATRTGTVTVAGQIFTVTQAGATTANRPPFDFDGDDRSDVSVFRPSSGTWYLNQSANGFTGANFGLGTDKLAAGDYDGDGKTDIGVFRPSTGTWYIQRSALGFTGIQFGASGDTPVPSRPVQ